MTAPDIDIQKACSTGRVAGSAVAALMLRVSNAAPGDLSENERRALSKAMQAAGVVAEIMAQRERTPGSRVGRQREVCGNYWRCMRDVCTGYARIAAECDRGLKAQELLETIFEDGLAFTQLGADELWDAGQRRLERIVAEGYEPKIVEVMGEEPLAAVRKAMAALRDALGLDATPADSEPVDPWALPKALSAFGRAIGAYGRAVAGTIDEDEPATEARFYAATRPIIAIRTLGPRNGGAADDLDPEAGDGGQRPATPVTDERPASPNNGGGPFTS